jgi:hypothetical protein
VFQPAAAVSAARWTQREATQARPTDLTRTGLAGGRRQQLRTGRTRLVLPTDRGHEVLAIARQLVPEIDDLVSGIVGADRLHALKADLEAIRRDISGR